MKEWQKFFFELTRIFILVLWFTAYIHSEATVHTFTEHVPHSGFVLSQRFSDHDPLFLISIIHSPEEKTESEKDTNTFNQHRGTVLVDPVLSGSLKNGFFHSGIFLPDHFELVSPPPEI